MARDAATAQRDVSGRPSRFAPVPIRPSRRWGVANERLRTAMVTAGVDLDDLVQATKADPKTVRRWLDGRTPQIRYRSTVVKLVCEDELYLWPELLDEARGRAATEAELVALYAQRSDVPSDLWVTLIGRAEHAIDILVYAANFLHEQNPRLNDLLADPAAAGCEIRVALGDPDGHCIKARGEDEDFGHGIVSRCCSRCSTTVR